MRSLGPKPTGPQLELLRKLAQPGAALHYCTGTRLDPSAWLSVGAGGRDEKVRTDTLSKFKDWGWVELASDPAWAWRGGEYTITGNGRAVAERGETRK